MVNKMPSVAKFCKKNKKFDEKLTAKSFKKKLSSFLHKGYLIKVDEKSYLLSEKEEHYLVLVYFERIFFDLFKNIKFEKEEKEIRVLFRMTLIQKCLENLQEILLASFYVRNETKNPFKIRFPHLWYVKNLVSSWKQGYDVIKDLHYWPDLDEMEDLFCPEINILVYEDDEIDHCIYVDGYGKEFHVEEGEREVSYEMKKLFDMRLRRGTLFRDKMYDMRDKISDAINVKSYKIKL